MAIMFGNGKLSSLASTASKYIMRTEEFVATATATAADSAGWSAFYVDGKGASYSKINPKYYTETGESTTSFSAGVKYFCTYDLAMIDERIIDISADTFPGTYYVTGDTYARSEASGTDEFFQFIIPKAKVSAENTITLEAEGDPSVFNLNLRVMRPADGVMMKLVKYDLTPASTAADVTTTLIHNHDLNPAG